MTSTYKLKSTNLGPSLALPTTTGTSGQYLASTSSGVASWVDLPKNGNPSVMKLMIYAKRVRGLTNAAISTLMIQRSSIVLGETMMSGNPNNDNLFYSIITIPNGYSGVWMFDTSGKSSGGGTGVVRMIVTRNSTVLYDQRRLNYANGIGAQATYHWWHDFKPGDVVTFQIYDIDVTTATVTSITDTTAQMYGQLFGWWFDPNSINATNPYITVGNITYSTGTATQSGTTITGANGATWSNSMVGGLFVFDKLTGLNRYGIITAVTPPSQITLDTPYTVTSATSYTIWYGGIQMSQFSGTLVTGKTNITSNSNQLILGASPNQTTLSAPTPSGSITITLPNTTQTLFGNNTTDVLTNKTLTEPVINTTASIINSNVLIDTMTTSTTNTSAPILNTYFVGNVSEVISSSMIAQNGSVSANWTASSTISTFTVSSMYVLYIVGTNNFITYTSPNNLTPGVYKLIWNMMRTAATGIIRFEYKVDGATTFTTLRTYDSWTNPTCADRLEDYIVVTTSGNPLIFQAFITGKNTSAIGFECQLAQQFRVLKMG
jgi:hypothetical protein